jgi:predicted O-linked N-acetylglucosamine transferase (SPINDLY family)
MVGHFGESILRGVGLTDWIARDDDSFVAAAVALARDYLALTTIRAGLRDRFLASPLCSGRSFVQGFEKALLKLWETRN